MTAHDESIPPRPSKKPRKKKDEAARILNQLELRKALEDLGIVVSYDEFKLTITLEEPLQRPGIDPPQDFVPRPWCDTDDTALAEILNDIGFAKAISNTLIRDVVHLHAVTTQSFHPVREYLDGLRWDGVPRIADFFATHCGALDDLNNDPDSKALDPELREQANDRLHKRIAYLRVVGQIFFVSAVARIFKPGCKNDCMLILEGPQSALKSTLLRVLARRDEWFAENPPDRFDKDAMLWLLGIWFAEYAEVDYHLKRGSKFKAWVSTSTDRYRPPYARSPVYVGRQCVFVGTTNRTDYLHDRTPRRSGRGS
jgi:putative DNA primase/helicase